MGQLSSKSSKTELEKRKIVTKRLENTRSVRFLPYPYAHSNSKSPTSARERIVYDLLTRYARQDGCLCVDYLTLGATVEVPGRTMDAAVFIDFSRQMMEVFPDFHFEYKLLGETSPGVVVAIVQACGTHSQGSYSTFLNPEPLPAQNIKCKNDPEYFTCVFKGLKVNHCSFLPVLKDTRNHGPDGFYKQIKEAKEQENLNRVAESL